MEGDQHYLSSAQTLRTAFTKAEKSHPGLAQQFISGVLDADGISLNLPEVLLRLASNECEEYTITCDTEEFQLLQEKAISETELLLRG